MEPLFWHHFIINFLCWPVLLILGFALYGYKNKLVNLIIVSVSMQIVTSLAIQFENLDGFGTFAQCITMLLLIWRLRFKKQWAEAVLITATILGIGILVRNTVYFFCDPSSRIEEDIILALTFAGLAQLVVTLKLQFTFIRSPRVKAKHGWKTKRISVGFFTLLSLSGYMMSYLPDHVAFFLVTAAIIFDLIYLMAHSIRLELE
ncbi:hypothetical protein ACLBWT_18615 [Paenibacillus sp. D51F]